MNQNNNIGKDFALELIKKANLVDVPADWLTKHTNELARAINQRMSHIIIENVSEQDAIEFNEKFSTTKSEQPDFNKMQQFLSQKIPDLDKKIQTSLDELADEYLKQTK